MGKSNSVDKNTTLTPKVAVDAVLLSTENIFSSEKNKLKVLLIKLRDGPYKDTWCLPGGNVGNEESLEAAVKRVLFQKTNVTGVFLEQLYAFGEPNRDKRHRAVSVAYYAILKNPKFLKIKTSAYYGGIEWVDIGKLPEMAFDHKIIIQTAHQRLKTKINSSNIVYNFLPLDFTLSQLQDVYETIMQKKLDKRNFRKRILALGVIEKSHKRLIGNSFRPAEMYHFVQRKLIFV